MPPYSQRRLFLFCASMLPSAHAPGLSRNFFFGTVVLGQSLTFPLALRDPARMKLDARPAGESSLIFVVPLMGGDLDLRSSSSSSIEWM